MNARRTRSATPPRRRWVHRIVLVLGSVLVTLVCLELLLRVGYFVQHRIKPSQSRIDPELGWVATPNLSISYDKEGYGRVDYATDEYGSRRMGDPNTSKIKLLAIGDSTTQAAQVSNGQTYYDYIATHEDRLEVFAYGVGGYGPLQEKLALDRLAPRIDPDIVVWQLHDNDIVNSDVRLEAGSTSSNNHMTRPYLVDGRVVLLHPDGAWGALESHSDLFRRLAVARTSIEKRTSGSYDQQLSTDDPDLLRALATMRAVIGGAIAEAPDRTYLAFVVFSRERVGYAPFVYQQVCKTPGLHCVTDIEERIRDARAAGETVDGGSDAHWNARGHAIAGQAVLDSLRTHDLLRKRGRPPG